MASNIVILGSTGSIGVQTLEVARSLGLNVLGLVANSNIELLEIQAREFRPLVVAVNQPEYGKVLAERLKDTGIEVYSGIDGMIKAATIDGADTVVTSVVGSAGLLPTIAAIKKRKNIALANKETLVTAGAIIMEEARKNGVFIIPVDSEHSAIFQCLNGNKTRHVKKIFLTASGGPFRGKPRCEIMHVSPEEALKHPNWRMGKKITIDSATLMNKGLEVIEARWLFDLRPEQIEVLIHPQSVIHSMVEYVDGSILAQLGPPDMRIPIQFALTYPDRSANSYSRLNLLETCMLTFEKPDYDSFPCLKLAYEALRVGGTMPAVMNAANEAAVEMFLNRKIGFYDIPNIIQKVMQRHDMNINPSLDDIIEVEQWARRVATSF